MKFEDKVIKLRLSIGYSVAMQEDEHKLSDYHNEKDWNAMSKDEQEEELYNIAKEWAENYIEFSGTIEE